MTGPDSRNAPAVVVLGRVGYDLFAEERDTPLKSVRTFSRYLGGSSANMAVGLARLGLRVEMISCLGDDALSRFLIEYLEGEGVSTRAIQIRKGALPSLCLTEVSPPDRFPQVFYRENAADTMVSFGEKEKELISGASMLLTNGTSLCASPSRESTLAALEHARRSGAAVAFDVDYRAMSWPSPQEAGLYARIAAGFCDLFIANPTEIALTAEVKEPEAAMSRLREIGVPIVVAKLGSAGTQVTTAEESLFLPPYPVEVTSTIGAGDGFASGFLGARLLGKSLAQSLQFGNAAAAIVVSRLMCSEAMPRMEEISDLIERHPEIRPQPGPKVLKQSML